jgi:hypothetical protein
MDRTLADGPAPYSESSPLDILAKSFRSMFANHLEHPRGRRHDVVVSDGWPGQRPILTGRHMTPYFAELVLGGDLSCLRSQPEDMQRSFLALAVAEAWRMWRRPYDGPAALETFGVVVSDIPGNTGDLRGFEYAAFVEYWLMPLVVRRALELDVLERRRSDEGRSMLDVAEDRRQEEQREEAAAIARNQAASEPAEA